MRFVNYRHAYHTGNFADVLKHIVLALCLDYLRKKDGPLCIVDAHAGAGRYDLNSAEAAKTGEWERGIGSLSGWGLEAGDLKPYFDLIREDLDQGHYPGSPLLIARQLRAQDRLIAAELHEETFEAVQTLLAPFRNTTAMHMDAYECIRAHVPPRERRGLVLVDPPFERKDEFERLGQQMLAWKRRWPTGVYLLWYPIKAHLPVEPLKEAARAVSIRRTWWVEVLISPRHVADRLNGCGLIVFNAPYTIPERVETLLPSLKAAMNLHETACGWATPAL